MLTLDKKKTIESVDLQNAATKPEISPWKYGLVGILFGVVFVKAELISWFRIQEMFRLDSFHMYGVIGSAVVVGLISVQLIQRFNIKNCSGRNSNYS